MTYPPTTESTKKGIELMLRNMRKFERDGLEYLNALKCFAKLNERSAQLTACRKLAQKLYGN